MSEQPLDLRRSLRIVWRHKLFVGILILLGVVAGAGYTAYRPPMPSATALVVLAPPNGGSNAPPAYGNSTLSQNGVFAQALIARSDPVLSAALRDGRLTMPLATLRDRITVGNPADNVISISARAPAAVQAERAANAVARSYAAYVSSGKMPGAAVPAQVLQPATDATGGSLVMRMLATAGAGALAGLLAGGICALAISGSDQRLRERDAIAEAIGAPVLASIPVRYPRAVAGWRQLLENYQPSAVGAWRLRGAMHHLSLACDDGSCASLTMLSLSSDRKALALGPQLAVFAASLGIPTALVIGPQQDVSTAAMLRAACLALPEPSGWLPNLQVAVCDDDTADLPPAGLTVVVTVVDGTAPEIASMIRTSATVLGVSAGAASAEQLARAAASAAAGGRQIAGIFVADPDSADRTTGLRPQLVPPMRPWPPADVTGTTQDVQRANGQDQGLSGDGDPAPHGSPEPSLLAAPRVHEPD